MGKQITIYNFYNSFHPTRERRDAAGREENEGPPVFIENYDYHGLKLGKPGGREAGVVLSVSVVVN